MKSITVMLLIIPFFHFPPQQPPPGATGYALLVGTTLYDKESIEKKYGINANYAQGEKCVQNDVSNINLSFRKINSKRITLKP